MNPHFDMYYDNPSNRSPVSQRHGSLHRQGSRNQFESHGYLPSGLYTAEDHVRYEPQRFGGDMRNATVGGYGGGYDMSGQSWNAGAFNANHSLNGLGGPGLRKPPSRGGRSGIPSAWMDQPQSMQMNQMNHFMGGLGGMNGPMRQEPMISEPEDELIPTAIVIKNIPFAIKKEQLVDIMTNMGLPLPYAFNYHFDNGVFRGLAFANFTNPDETAAVIDAMNHFELNGRKLRVEYKKMLPAAERERIEREKRERRGQLEEQHRPMAPTTLQTQVSTSSLTSSRMLANSPSPVSGRNASMNPGQSFGAPSSDVPGMGSDVDLNDPMTLEFYNKLLLFKHDQTRDRYPFPPTLSPQERRIVHTVAHHLALGHMSKGEANQRAVHVYKEGPRRVSPPMPQISNLRYNEGRSLNRAATTDFTDVRGGENYYNGPRHQGSGYLGTYQEPSAGLGPGSNLRAAKSFADLRSYTPSPVPSTASFPAALRNNVASFQDLNTQSSNPTQSSGPTIMTPTSGLSDRGENSIINGLGNMNLGGGFGGSPNRLRGIASWDRETPGPIGGHRSFSTNFDDRSQGRPQGGPERQPRGPLPERGAGFPRNRQNGHVTRNSDELSQPSSAEITVE